MSVLECAVLVVAIALPFHRLMQRYLRLLADPRYLRDHGVVIVADRVLESHSPPIGEYMGHPIWGAVTFMGMQYRFDRIIDSRKRESIAAHELYLEPGLVYRTD
jgi:hypothetical protein